MILPLTFPTCAPFPMTPPKLLLSRLPGIHIWPNPMLAPHWLSTVMTPPSSLKQFLSELPGHPPSLIPSHFLCLFSATFAGSSSCICWRSDSSPNCVLSLDLHWAPDSPVTLHSWLHPVDVYQASLMSHGQNWTLHFLTKLYALSQEIEPPFTPVLKQDTWESPVIPPVFFFPTTRPTMSSTGST